MTDDSLSLGEKVVKELLDGNPVLDLLEISDVRLKTNGDLALVMPVGIKHTNIHGAVHGGIFVILMDTAMGYACHAKTGASTVTVNIDASFIANCRPGATLSTVGRIVHSGRRIVVAESECYDGNGKLLASSEGTFFLVNKEPQCLSQLSFAIHELDV